MKFTAAASTLFLAGSALAAPAYPTEAPRGTPADGPITADMIKHIRDTYPDSVSKSGVKTCPADEAECTEPEVAAPALNRGFAKYKITSKGQIAAVFSLTMYESGAYRYRRNISNNNPGQGTSNMQSIENNVKYANSLPGIKEKAAPLVGNYQDPTTAEKILDLVANDDDVNFASGQWYMATHLEENKEEPEKSCTQAVKDALNTNPTTETYKVYLTNCVGALPVTPARLQGFTAAMELLK